MQNKNIFVADFETTTNPDDCRVWAFSIAKINDENFFEYGTNINDFFKWCEKGKSKTIYFHNLKFDGEFIFFYLLNNGFTFIKDKKEKRDKTFTCLISDLSQFYQIEVYFSVGKHRSKKITFLDSMKIFNDSVDKIAESFKLPISKLKIDYKKERPLDYKLTDDEIDYIKNDVKIIALALRYMYDNDFKKMTIGSNALNFYKEMLKDRFNSYFPQLEKAVDETIRPSYKGGFTYLNPIYKDKIIEDIKILDVNSLYPSVLYYEKMPIGNPIYFRGKYEEDILYDLFIQGISCSFKLKKNKIPCIQIKKSFLFRGNEYLENSNNEIVNLWLTSVDLKLFFEQYEVYELEYIGGYKFKSQKGLFCNYIEHFTKQKIEAKKNGDGVKYMTAKLFLNSLYGKFASSITAQPRFPEIKEDGTMHYPLLEKEDVNGVYLPVGAFVTAYARYKTITTSQKIKDFSRENYGKDMYIYSDTDSIHTTLPIEDCKKIIDIDSYRLGAWDYEHHCKRGKYIRQKCYIDEFDDGTFKITCAGMTDRCKTDDNGNPIINFDNFKEGLKIDRKLVFKHVKGGIILTPTTFEIKAFK